MLEQVDPAASRIGFEVWTRYGQRLDGEIAAFQGQLEHREDGRKRFVVRLQMDSAHIPGHRRYTRWMRGQEFFDVAHHRLAEFESAPFVGSTSGTPGVPSLLDGWLTLRGVRHPVQLHIAPGECARAGYDCPVTARGEVSRAAYGMDRWQFAVSDRVTFVLHVRLSGAGAR